MLSNKIQQNLHSFDVKNISVLYKIVRKKLNFSFFYFTFFFHKYLNLYLFIFLCIDIAGKILPLYIGEFYLFKNDGKCMEKYIIKL